jgi:hypothetical protein
MYPHVSGAQHMQHLFDVKSSVTVGVLRCPSVGGVGT